MGKFRTLRTGTEIMEGTIKVIDKIIPKISLQLILDYL